MMRLLSAFRPRLIGSTLTGHTRAGSDIDIHVFANTESGLTAVLDETGYAYDVEHKRVVKHNEERVFTHVHVHDRFRYELTLYDLDSGTRLPVRAATLDEVLAAAEKLLGVENAPWEIDRYLTEQLAGKNKKKKGA